VFPPPNELPGLHHEGRDGPGLAKSRKRAMIARWKPERLKWTDETVRVVEVSRFLS
jgi:hypothetical protein